MTIVIIVITILVCLLFLILDVYGKRYKYVHDGTRSNIYKENVKLYVNQPWTYVEKPITDTGDNIVNNIQKDKTHKNIRYDTDYLGKTCITSNDCLDGMVCASSDNETFKCTRNIPVMECSLPSCEQKQSKLGDSCGGVTLNVLGNACIGDNNLQCVSDKRIHTSSGTCSIIR